MRTILFTLCGSLFFSTSTFALDMSRVIGLDDRAYTLTIKGEAGESQLSGIVSYQFSDDENEPVDLVCEGYNLTVFRASDQLEFNFPIRAVETYMERNACQDFVRKVITRISSEGRAQLNFDNLGKRYFRKISLD